MRTASLALLLVLTGAWLPETRAEEPRFAISVGDRVRIEIGALDAPPLEVTVPPGGELSVPGVGVVACAGKNPAEVRRSVEAELREQGFVGSPGVTVNVVAFRPRFVYVLEGVRRPGAYELPLDGSIRLSQALGLAGGLAPGARRAEVRIHREHPEGGLPAVLRFDLTEITAGNRVENDIPVLPADTIVIPDEAHPDGWIYVGGAVQEPGRYPLLHSDRLTALRAILLAGGLAPGADASAVRLLRDPGSGEPTTSRVDLRAAVRGDAKADPRLQPRDVVIVPGAAL